MTGLWLVTDSIQSAGCRASPCLRESSRKVATILTSPLPESLSDRFPLLKKMLAAVQTQVDSPHTSGSDSFSVPLGAGTTTWFMQQELSISLTPVLEAANTHHECALINSP